MTVTVYSKSENAIPSCYQCRMLKRLFDARGIMFDELHVDEDAEAMAFLEAQGIQRVPAVFEDGRLVFTGFDPDGFRKLKEGA